MKRVRFCLTAAATVLLVIGAIPADNGDVTAAARPHLYQIDIGVNVFWNSVTVNQFNPAKLTIRVGDSVRWTNVVLRQPQTVTFGPPLVTPPLITRADNGEVNPSVTKPQGGRVIGDVSTDVFSSGALVSGITGLPASYTFTFPKPGLYLYRSLFHPAMSGEIDVVAAGQPVPAAVDHGPTMYDALKGAGEVLGRVQAYARNAGASPGDVEIEVGGGTPAISFNQFYPPGVTVSISTTVTWNCRETSGDPHALVFGALTTAEDGGDVPLYTGLAADGGLTINPDYATPSVPSGTRVLTDTFSDQNSLYTSGLLYGSFINYPSITPARYSLTFRSLGQFTYSDPFHPGMQGVVTVVP